MCLAIPMEVVAIEADGSGWVMLDGLRQRVGLELVEARVGDHVLVHAGYAIETLDLAEAEARLALFRDLAAAWQRKIAVEAQS
ncbi:MAG: HypC/HybG/HupF family hydrogenase formation chaperone [Magnetococcales bacterium]|nr:HypC/HybG/HupF family hydrogenase formation chaperone [Magnetococcales bacterium]